MLDIPSVVVVLAAFANVILLWWFVVMTVPRLARLKLEIGVQRVHDSLLDAHRRGEIECDQGHLEKFLEYCRLVIVGASRVSLVSAFFLRRRLKLSGIDVDRPVPASPDQVLREAEQLVDVLVWDYMVGGSRLWWILRPVRAIGQRTDPDNRSRLHRWLTEDVIGMRPSALASELREAAEGDRGTEAQSMTRVALEKQQRSPAVLAQKDVLVGAGSR
jgi:hypothetical protein